MKFTNRFLPVQTQDTLWRHFGFHSQDSFAVSLIYKLGEHL